MAGTGERFKAAGYKTPKPLIEVHGKPIIEHVINLFPSEKDFLFVCNKDHLKNTNLRAILSKLKPSGKIIGIDPKKLGPVYAILKAKKEIKDSEPTIVMYCDFNLKWNYAEFKKRMKETKVDSSAVCYTGFLPHLLKPNVYAGVRVDDSGNALEVREKFSFTENKMESWHQAGMFYFRTGEILKKYCQKTFKSAAPIQGEYYISFLYNFMINDGLTSSIYPVKHFCQWGTPEDLQEYLWSHSYWESFFKSKF